MSSKTRRILFVLVLMVVMVLTTTPPIAAKTAEPAVLLRPSVAMLDVAHEAAEIAETISQIWEWFVSTDDDKSEEQDTEVQT